MHRLKSMEETLIGCVQAQLANISNADTKELGEAVDMIKDFEQAMYYHCMSESLKENKEEKKKMKEELEKLKEERPQEYHHYYTEKLMPYYLDPYMYPPFDRDMDKEMGRMYYSERQPRNSQGEFTDGRGRDRRYYDGNTRSGDSSNGGNGNSTSGMSSGGNGGSRNFYEREIPFDLRDSREGRSPMSRRNYMESKEMHQDKEKKIKELEKYMQELSQDIVEMIEDASPEEKQMLEKKMTHLTSKIAQLNTNA